MKNGTALRRGRARTSAALSACLILALHIPTFGAQRPQAARGPADRARLELAEDLSESLANDLVDLSLAVRARDFERVADFIPPRINSAPFPRRPRDADVAKARRMIFSKPYVGTDSAVRPTSREEFLRGLSSFLASFALIEDARLVLDEANFADDARVVAGASAPAAAEGANGRARVVLRLVGRNPEGARACVTGTFKADVRMTGSNWVLDSFEPGPDFRWLAARRDVFTDVTAEAGVAAVLPPFGERGNDNQMHGAAAADFDGDGWIDLFVTAPYRNYLYLNDGTGRFRDVSEEAGVKALATGVAPLALDYDRDGATDVFISADGGQVLLQNRLKKGGRLEFRDVSQESGVGAARAVGFSAAAGDVNGDGLTDIYVASYNHYGRVTPDSWYRATNGTPNLLFVNRGDGTFTEEAKRWGVDDSRWTYAAGMADLDGDGRLDIYAGNDFGEKALFVNRGNRFVDEARARGVLDTANAMGIAFGDYNNDGRLDIHCTNMSSTAGGRILARLFPGETAAGNVLLKLDAGNTLFEGDGRGRFRDVSAQVGGLPAGWAWGGGFFDFDNDGWEDLYTTNGYVSGRSMKDTSSLYWRLIVTATASASRPDLDRLMSERGFSFAGYERDTLFMNVSAGRPGARRFTDVSGVSGVDAIGDGRGAVFADFDNDGDYDLFVTALQGESHLLFRNNVGQENRHLRVVLEGRAAGEAFGSAVRVRTSQGTLTKVKAGGSGFISQHDPRLLFGLGRDARARSVVVTWADGKVERFRGDFRANSTVLLREGRGRASTLTNFSLRRESSLRPVT
ncbi:MAG: CRTAC1 family protein [Acidobacteria bacterium]|nr:CRTAC1 family protein [Acidobacteriota bacterium]